MDLLWQKITEWLKEVLISGITGNLSGMFDATNQKVAEISGQIGATPQAWNESIFEMIETLSESVIVPIAGVILAIVMTLELVQLITEKNNLAERHRQGSRQGHGGAAGLCSSAYGCPIERRTGSGNPGIASAAQYAV